MNKEFYIPLSLTRPKLISGDCSIEEYISILKSISLDFDDNIRSFGYIISVLQDYIFSTTVSDLNDYYTHNAIFTDKKIAILDTLTYAEFLIGCDYFRMIYLSIMAQNYFMIGNFNQSLVFYEKLLECNGVLDCDYDPSYYAGELELASCIVHNMCVIHMSCGRSGKAIELVSKYGYIFKMEEDRNRRLINRNPHLKEGFEKEYKQLINISNDPVYYFDDTLCSRWIAGSILYAIYQDCEKSNRRHKVNLTRKVFQLFKKTDGRIEVLDTENGLTNDDVRIMEIDYS